MTTQEEPSWSDIAEWYDELLQAGSGPHETALDCLMRLVPGLGSGVIMDLACGQGVASRAIASSGARRVIGVDSSAAMLERDDRHRAPQGTDVAYVLDDAQTLATFDDNSFDGVTCQLALMDIPDLDATLSSVWRVLRPSGWFVFVIGHPCFLVPDAEHHTDTDGRPRVSITGYFEERFWRSSNPDGVRRGGNYRRTLSTYLNALVRARFQLEATEEPMASPLLAQQQALYTEVPIFFAALVRKGA